MIRIAILFFLLSSCITEKRCYEKFPPSVRDSIVYRDTTIFLPPDTIAFTFIDTCQDLDTVFIIREGGKEKGRVRIVRERGRMWVDCVTAPKSALFTLPEHYRIITRTIKAPWHEQLFSLMGKFFLFLLLVSIIIFSVKRWTSSK